MHVCHIMLDGKSWAGTSSQGLVYKLKILVLWREVISHLRDDPSLGLQNQFVISRGHTNKQNQTTWRFQFLLALIIVNIIISSFPKKMAVNEKPDYKDLYFSRVLCFIKVPPHHAHHIYLCKVWTEKMLQVQKLAISKNSLKLLLHWRNLVKITTSSANHFDKVSWLFEKNCDFSIYTNI